MLRLIGRTTAYGALAGLTLAGVYTMLAVTVMGGLAMFGMVSAGADGPGLLALPVAGGIMACGWLFAGVLGLLPGALLGAAGGAVTGCILALWPGGGLRGWLAGLPGVVVGLALGVLVNQVLGLGFLEDYAAGRGSMLPYFFWAVGPALLMPLGLAWAGWRAIKKLEPQSREDAKDITG